VWKEGNDCDLLMKIFMCSNLLFRPRRRLRGCLF
jgi:hypothetical protein